VDVVGEGRGWWWETGDDVLLCCCFAMIVFYVYPVGRGVLRATKVSKLLLSPFHIAR